MKKLSLLTVVAVFLLLTGCSSKKVYEPEYIVDDLSSHSCQEVVAITAKGATLEEDNYISLNNSGTTPDGFSFVDDSNGAVFVNDSGLVKTGSKTIDLKDRVITASIVGNSLAFITFNNRYGLYDLQTQKIVFQNIDSAVNTLNVKTVPPVQIDELIIFPTLNGKLVVVSNNEIVREITITPNADFNNIIFLGVLNNTLIAATATDIIALGGKTMERQKHSVADIVLSDKNIYLFTKDGKVIRMNENLKQLQQKEFQFANFIHAQLHDGYIYAVEKAGYLLAFDEDLDHKVYELDDAIEELSFLKGKTLYYGGRCHNP